MNFIMLTFFPTHLVQFIMPDVQVDQRKAQGKRTILYLK